MRKSLYATMFVLATINHSFADVIDDNVAKAERAVASASKRLDTAKQCQANRETCMADMKAKADKRLAAAQKAVAALN